MPPPNTGYPANMFGAFSPFFTGIVRLDISATGDTTLDAIAGRFYEVTLGEHTLTVNMPTASAGNKAMQIGFIRLDAPVGDNSGAILFSGFVIQRQLQSRVLQSDSIEWLSIAQTGTPRNMQAFTLPPLDVNDHPTGGNICDPSDLLTYGVVRFTQTTAGQTLTLPVPGDVFPNSKVMTVFSLPGNVNTTMYGVTLPPQAIHQFYFNGASWLPFGTALTGGYLPLSGGTMTGAIDLIGNATGQQAISAAEVDVKVRGAVGGVFEYLASVGVGGSPATGKIRWDASPQASATEVHINYTTANSLDMYVFLQRIFAGSILLIQDQLDSDNYQEWKTIDDPTDYGTYWSYPVVLLNSGGSGSTSFPNNQEVFVYASAAAIPQTTDNLPEGTTNLYFLPSRAVASVLTGWTIGTNTAVLPTDTISQAIGKLAATSSASASSGANSDITSLSGLTGGIATPTYISFNTVLSAPSYLEGRLFYDSVNHSLAVYTDVPSTPQHLGRELLVRVRNQSGAPILNGKAVYISDATGQTPLIELAKADAATTAFMLGVVSSGTIANNGYGYVTMFGEVGDLNTAGFLDGELVYLSATTAGEFTATAPTQPNYQVLVGFIEHSHITQGKLLVRSLPRYVAANAIVGSIATSQISGLVKGATSNQIIKANAAGSYADITTTYTVALADANSYLRVGAGTFTITIPCDTLGAALESNSQIMIPWRKIGSGTTTFAVSGAGAALTILGGGTAGTALTGTAGVICIESTTVATITGTA